MRIPTREEQARYGSLNAHDTQRFNVQERTPNASLQINADMFGAGQARAMGEGARALQYGARQVAHWYRENELTKATETFTKYQESLNDDLYGENGIFTSKGEAALDAPKRANDLLKKRAEEFSKNAGNDLGQEFFMQKAAGFNQQLMPRATLHAENERNSWMIATHSAAANNAINEAVKNYSNPDVFNQLMGEAAMNAALAAQKQGLPPEAVKMKRDKAVSDGYMLVGQGLLAAGDIKGAMGILESGRLDGQDGIRFKANINQEQKRLQAEARANAAEAKIGIIVGETDNMYQQFGNDLESGYAYIREKYKNDPRMRLEVESSFSGRVRMEEAAANKTQQIRLNEIKNSSIDAIGSQDATPASVSKVIAEAPPEIQPVLTSAARMRFPSQEVVVSDAGKLSEAKAAILTGEIKDEKQLRQNYMPYIASNELEKLEQSVIKNKDKESATSLRASFNTTMREYDIENLASSAGMTPAAYMGATWNAFIDEAFDHNLTTPQEKRQFMQEYLRKVSLSKERTVKGVPYWFDSNKEVPEFEARALRSEGYAEQEPQRPEGLPAEAVWDSAKVGWVYNNKFLPAAKVVR